MSNYLTKEEIRQWRSSLEKITLEEFAARLGKTVEESKSTNDVVDIVMSKGTSSNSNADGISDSFSAIAERAFKRERQISHTPFSVDKNNMVEKTENTDVSESAKIKQQNLKDMVSKALAKSKEKQPEASNQQSMLDKVSEYKKNRDVHIVLKKGLTDREQMVFEYFLNNIGKTVYAKDLAELLDLPRDYVYKYIKNLRSKIEGDKLKNVQSGGFILTE